MCGGEVTTHAIIQDDLQACMTQGEGTGEK